MTPGSLPIISLPSAPRRLLTVLAVMPWWGVGCNVVISALGSYRGIRLVERTQLQHLLEECDLAAVDIVKNPKLLGNCSVEGIDYLVIGTLTRLKE